MRPLGDAIDMPSAFSRNASFVMPVFGFIAGSE
jgi:hypothetical protein